MTAMELGAVQDLIVQYGHAMLLLATVVEGPVVTLLAAALAQEGLLDLRWVLGLAILGDVLGDVIVHLAGRFAAGMLPARACRRLGLDRHVIAPLAAQFRHRGGRMLVVAKLTHFAGLPVLFASGVAGMPLLPFLLVSLGATIPKVAALCALGWMFGLALTAVQPPLWLMLCGVALSALAIAGLMTFPMLRKRGSLWT